MFVGGTSRLEAGRLEKSEAQALQKRASALRKIPGIGSAISFGGAGDGTLRLLLLEDELLEIVVSGLPPEAGPQRRCRGSGGTTAVPAPLAPLATLLQDLAALRPPQPAAVRAILYT